MFSYILKSFTSARGERCIWRKIKSASKSCLYLTTNGKIRWTKLNMCILVMIPASSIITRMRYLCVEHISLTMPHQMKRYIDQPQPRSYTLIIHATLLIKLRLWSFGWFRCILNKCTFLSLSELNFRRIMSSGCPRRRDVDKLWPTTGILVHRNMLSFCAKPRLLIPFSTPFLGSCFSMRLQVDRMKW